MFSITSPLYVQDNNFIQKMKLAYILLFTIDISCFYTIK